MLVAEKGVGFEGCQQKPTRRDQRRTGQKHLNHGVDDTKAQRVRPLPSLPPSIPPPPTTRKPQESICHFCHGKRQRTARREREGERGERTDCNTAKVVNSFFSAVGGRSLPENARPVCHGGGSDAPPHLSLWIIMIGQRDGLSYPASPSGRARSIAG